MINTFSDYYDDFLKPDESNLSSLIEKIKTLHGKIQSMVRGKSPMIPINPNFTYDDKLKDMQIPESSVPSNEVLIKATASFEGLIRFHEPTALYNITPPPLLDTVAISSLISLYNPNLLWDSSAGKIILFEKAVIKYLCDLAGFDYTKADGFSCSGGKATFMYAIKEGITKCNRTTIKEGIKDKYTVITAKACHYAVESACNYLGIGQSAVKRINCDAKEEMIMEDFEQVLKSSIEKGEKIACIIVSGGGTLDVNVDNIKRVWEIRNAIVEQYKLDYIPHLHVDTVIGWVWLFFRYYDFDKNILKIESKSLSKIKNTYDKLSNISLADSMSADFHKTGFCPYISSFYVSKSGENLNSLNREELFKNKGQKYGDFQIYQSSIENSRPGTGVMSAWVVINKFGKEGFQKYLAYLLSTSEYFKTKLQNDYKEHFEIINDFGSGHCIMLMPKSDVTSLSYYSLMKAPKEERELYNNYCADLYKYISFELPRTGEDFPLLGYLSVYRGRTLGSDLSAFKIFATSMYLDENECDRILELMLETKVKFEKERKLKQGYKEFTVHEHQPS